MKKLLFLLCLCLLTVSCGARKRIKSVKKDDVKVEERTKIDSVVTEKNTKEVVTVVETKSEEFEYTFEPVPQTSGSPEAQSTTPKRIKIKTPNGKETEIEYPNGTKVNVRSRTSTENKSETSKEDSEKKAELNKDQASSTESSNVQSDSSTDRKEPFNLTIMWFVLGAVVLIIVYLVLKRFKII